MITVLKEDLAVTEKGLAVISLDLSNFIHPSLGKVPFQFNDSENQIIIKTRIIDKDIQIYEENYIRQHRRFLLFKVEENIKKNKQKLNRALENIKISFEDPKKLKKTLESIKKSYVIEKSYTFYFNRSKYLKKFLNTKFDLQLLKSEGKDTQIIFNFKSIHEITPRTLNTTITQGTLIVHKEAPPKLIKTFLRKKNYAIVKITSLMEQHSEDFKNIYDIIITFNEEIINKIYMNKDYDNPNVFFGKYTQQGGVNTQHFYLSKLRFNDFLKSKGNLRLYIKELKSNNRISLEFDENLYDQFLLDFNHYSIEQLEEVKEKAWRGVSVYYSHVYDFLKSIKSEEFRIEKNHHQNFNNLLDKINEYDFSDITKREIFNVSVGVYFMDNLEVLISQDKSLKIDYSLNLLEFDLKYIFEKGFKLFNEKFQNLIDNREIHKISEDDYKNLFSLLKELKFRNLINFTEEFIKDFIYFFSILKNNISFVKNRFDLRNNVLLESIPLLLSSSIAFRNHFPKNYTNTHMDLFFASKFASFPEITQERLYEIKKSCRDLILMFLSAQDLKLIRKTFKAKFQSTVEFDSILKKIKDLIELKTDVKNDFDKILSDLKNKIKMKRDAGSNIDEITELLQEQLKEEFSSQVEFENAIKTIENMVKSKFLLNYTNIIEEINSFFKQDINTENGINGVLNFIKNNLEKVFKDKKKLNTILDNVRDIYELKIGNKKKYNRILMHLNKNFNNLTIEEDVKRIKNYIEKNLKDIFSTPSEQQSVLLQVEQAFKNRTENPKELDDIVKLSFGVIQLLISDTFWYNILTASVFSLFVLAIDKDKYIKLGSICSLLKTQPASLSLHVKKIIEDYTNKKSKQRFKDLRVKNEETRDKIRYKLVDLLLTSQVQFLLKSVEDKNRNPKKLVDEFQFRLDFFLRYVQFDEALNSVSGLLIDKFIMNYLEVIKKEIDSKTRKLLISNLIFRINFFKNYKVFRVYLLSLKDEILEVCNEPAIEEVIAKIRLNN